MTKCDICGNDLIDTLTDSRKIIEIEPDTSTGRRIAKALCWVCRRLGASAVKHALD